MRFKLSPALTLCAIVILAATGSHAQDGQDDQKIVDDFVTTRGVTFEQPGTSRPQPTPTRPTTARPTGQSGKQQSSSKPSSSGRKKPNSSDTAANRPNNSNNANTNSRPASDENRTGDGSASLLNVSATEGGKKPIGLGFTLYVKQGQGFVAADPSREFRGGDQLRIALETNTDGYLYIFYTENGRNPQMIYPNAAVDKGGNFVGAHARDFYPTDLSAWFEFDNVPATERLYFVVSRSPLAGVPTDRDLIAYCGGSNADCLWKPSAAQWERIKSSAGGSRVVEGRTQLAKLETQPTVSLTRGIKVKKEEPPPALVRINDKADADIFVTTIDLIHK